jgi:hypothetical protein
MGDRGILVIGRERIQDSAGEPPVLKCPDQCLFPAAPPRPRLTRRRRAGRPG